MNNDVTNSVTNNITNNITNKDIIDNITNDILYKKLLDLEKEILNIKNRLPKIIYVRSSIHESTNSINIEEFTQTPMSRL